jgi:uncharacterized protein (DUF58 family)
MLPAALSPRARFRRWWMGRLRLTDTTLLGQRNIYILPTRAGLTFAATLVVMLLAAINYQLNLGFALTFLLAGAGLVSMHGTHANLRGLTLHLKPTASVFVGEAAKLEVVINNPGRLRYGLALRFEDAAAGPADAVSWCDVPAYGHESMHLALTPERRGWHPVPTLVVQTVFPFGLFRAWTVWRPAGRFLAWPRPETGAPPLPVAAAMPGPETRQQRGSDGGEFDGVRPWRRGDTMRQVVWKKAARANELVSRETAGSGRHEVWLDWTATALSGTEARLARLAAWVLAAERAALPWGLRLPGHELAPAAGAPQRLASLDLLATYA